MKAAEIKATTNTPSLGAAQQAINQLDNPMRIKAVKKDIARIKTVEREIELAGSNS